MGIPRFSTRIRDYAKHTTLGTTDSPRGHSYAIIDGPGLAHHIYYKLCEQSVGTVTYASCAKATVEWLDRLEEYGFKIEAIFFDGALPPTKKDIRIQRLQSYIDRLQGFKKSFGTSPASIGAQVRKSLPPLPFLVFAVVEELMQCSFAGVTYVVLGEADPYCVALARALSLEASSAASITIFSDDTDLLVYETDSRTRIVPFRDLVEVELDAGGRNLQGDEYRPSEIAGRFKSTDLIKPAFFMSLDNHCSLEKAFKLSAGADVPTKVVFDEFIQSFVTQGEFVQLTQIRADPKIKAGLTSLDSRVSELVYQLNSSTDGDIPGGLLMYLPFLLDDPSRSTAWAIGTDIRLLAYSILLQTHGSDAGVQEYRRSGTRVASSLLEPLPEVEISNSCTALVKNIRSSESGFGEDTVLVTTDIWRYVAVQAIVRRLQGEGISLPSTEELVHVVMNRESRKWSQVHLASQFQAAFYSLRILQQVTAYTTRKLGLEVDPMLSEVHQRVQSLPRVAIFFEDEAGSDRTAEHRVWTKVLSHLTSPSYDDVDAEDSAETRPRKKPKKTAMAKKGNGSLVTNPFAMLAE